MRPLVRVAAGALLISAAPIMVKVLAARGVGATPIAMWRVWIASATLLAIARVRFGTIALPRRTGLLAAAAGAAFAADLFVWHRSILLVGAGMATILGNTQVFWTTALGYAIHGEPLSRRFALAAALAFGGVVVLAGVGSHVPLSPGYLVGAAFGLATGVLYAVYLLALRAANRAPAGPAPAPPERARAVLVLAWATAAAGALLAGAALIEGAALAPPDAASLALLAALALGAQVLAWLAISSALAYVPAAKAALVLLLQPACATLAGALLFAEHLTALQLAGAAATMGAVVLGSRT